jgi:hypothetical protein
MGYSDRSSAAVAHRDRAGVGSPGQPMIYGYVLVSTDGQSVDAQVRELTKAGCKKVFRETASGTKTDRAQLAKALATLDADDVLR